MKKFFSTFLIVASLFFASTVNAEIQTYTGVGEYLMSDFETFDVAQQRAKQRAEQNACEQAGVFVESRTEVQNAQVTRDEIITMTSGILKIVDVQFKREIVNDNTMCIRATITANIDSDDIDKWLAKSLQERSTLVEQNEELRRANAEQDKQISALKEQLADVKTQADRERITQQFADKYIEQPFVREVLNLVNEERAKISLPPLKFADDLSASALIRVRELPRKFSHTRPNGSNYFTAMAKLGYAFDENIAGGQKTPRQVVQAWMDSPSKRANILNRKYNEIGIAYYYHKNSKYKHYWIQLFRG